MNPSPPLPKKNVSLRGGAGADKNEGERREGTRLSQKNSVREGPGLTFPNVKNDAGASTMDLLQEEENVMKSDTQSSSKPEKSTTNHDEARSNAVDWTRIGRPQMKDMTFQQTKPHASSTVSHNGREMTIWQRSCTPKPASRIVLKSASSEQQQQQQHPVLSRKSRRKLLAGHPDRIQSQAPSPNNAANSESSFQVDFRVHGVSQDDIYKDEERMAKMQKLADRLQHGYRDKSIMKDVKQEDVTNVFTEESKRTLEKLGNNQDISVSYLQESFQKRDNLLGMP